VVVAATGVEQLGGSLDQQRRRTVTDLESRDPAHQPPQASTQHGPDPEPDGPVLANGGRSGAADGVDDGQGGEEPGDDR
jgi:hypothetical protein